MALKIQVFKCGRCGKARGLTHTCVTRLNRRTKPGKTRLKPRATATCGTCGKSRGLNHTCHVTTDFKKRKAEAARRKAAEDRRRKQAKRKQAGQQKQSQQASQQQGQQRKANGRPAHDPAICRGLGDCTRFACQAWAEGYQAGDEMGQQDGRRAGWSEGHVGGYRQGFHLGYDKGRKDCEETHK